MEMIAILEALLKWEDKLLGRRINIVTDHKAIEFFKDQKQLSNRQTRWMEFLSRFNHEVVYVQGHLNKVADCLSRYYMSDREGETHPRHVYVNADARLDPEGEDLPMDRILELRAMQTRSRTRKIPQEEASKNNREPKESIPPRDVEARELNVESQKEQEAEKQESTRTPEDPSWAESQQNGPKLPPIVEEKWKMEEMIKEGYRADSLLTKIIEKPEEHKLFAYRNGILWKKERNGGEVKVVPRGKWKGRRLTELVITTAHEIIGHLGSQKTEEYTRRWFWWPSMGIDIRKYCRSCHICQTTKSDNQKPMGLLHNMPILSRPWGSIGMDFVGPFPPSQGHDYLWVVICRLTSMVHLIPVKTTVKASELAWIFVKEIVRLHGLPDSIVSDRDTKFTSKFWKEVHRILGIKLLMSTAFHPQTDGASERAIRTIGQILRASVQPDQRDWVERVPMVEFAINSSTSRTTGLAPFELNGTMPRMMGDMDVKGTVPGVRQFMQQVRENLLAAHDAIIESRVNQTHFANKRRRNEGNEFEGYNITEGELAYLSTKNLSLPKGRASKLLPKFIGPYKVVKAFQEKSMYELELPEELRKRGIFPKFHVSLLRKHVANDEALFPNRDPMVYYDFGTPDEAEWLVDGIIGHQWKGNKPWFQVQWNLGDTTWEPLETCDELEALDRYLELMGVGDPKQLPRKR
ncbi:hypothetical protein NLI96_g8282 [Meripilus lineatus]|uniref:Integrase catalytic domain-containing protein n=1 Tax=Meripilus lineatus TaxID=2056292 RepID=A0AAD5UXV0_9APHY|nr:hypothetical protein NLI96_g8282 [Physisporinus lineatus]